MKEIGFRALFIICLLLVGCRIDSPKIEIYTSYEEGLQDSLKKGKKTLLVFDFLGNPTDSTHEIINDNEVITYLEDYTVIILEVDLPDEKGKQNKQLQIKSFNSNSQPEYYILDMKGNKLKGPLGYCGKDKFIEFIK